MGETDATAPRLRLYDTLRKEKVAFTPLDPANVRMYVCGPTVYDYAHIGNARPVIVFDVLFRLLRHLYGPEHVRYARNITDVDDKINARAARDYPGLPLNEAIAKVTAQTEAQFQADVTALGCLPPTVQPHATDHIEDMRRIIERLVARGVAYVAENHVLFSPAAMERLTGAPKYGSLARRSLDEMIAGARVDVAPYKRDAMDFVLWKPSKDQEPGWPSPCNITVPGRPGWHIECSAMSMATLLEPFGGGLSCEDPDRNTFDIHGGGIDLVFPHHENEIAQSCCAFGAEGAGTGRMAQIWMHNGFLQVEGRKMSKSEGNFVTIQELLKGWQGIPWSGDAIRFAMLMSKYRQPLDWTRDRLLQANDALRRWSDAAEGMSPYVNDQLYLINKFGADAKSSELTSILLDDINTPDALLHLNELYDVARSNRASSGVAAIQLHIDANLLGLNLDRHRSELKTKLMGHYSVDVNKVILLIKNRNEARREKNFAESDRIRDELVAMGIQIMDGKDPVTGELTTRWEVKR